MDQAIILEHCIKKIIGQVLQEYMETRNLQLVTRGKKPGSELRENIGKYWGLDIKGFC